MSATNSTANINLPLFIGTDKPSWLVDWNGAMNAIDAAIASLQAAESGTSTALASLAQSLEALSGTVGQHTTALQTLTTTVSGNTGSINTINSLIGNGQPTTTDKTIIGAINEINAKIPEGGTVEAADVSFDNTGTGLNATNAQAAIVEVNNKIPSIASVEEVQSGTLTAGQTSVVLTFTDQTIGATTLIDVYTGVYGVNPSSVAYTASTVTLTFAAQASDLAVAVKVQN